jgi:hypothetical protein
MRQDLADIMGRIRIGFDQRANTDIHKIPGRIFVIHGSYLLTLNLEPRTPDSGLYHSLFIS